MHSYNHTEQHTKYLYCLTRTEQDCISSQCVFKCNTSVTGHKQGTVGVSLHKTLPRSNVNSTLKFCTWFRLLSLVFS